MATRLRRPPPEFRRLSVLAVTPVTPRLVRVTLGGPGLAGFPPPETAASVRLLLPIDGRLVVPEWTGNEFRLPDGSRPPIRTFTPRRYDPEAGALDLELVVHGEGAASAWATAAAPGDEVGLSGPGRGTPPDPAATAVVLAGDETALPAVSQLVEALAPSVTRVEVHLEVADDAARLDLPDRAGLDATWHVQAAGAPPGERLVAAVEAADLDDGAHVWAAGEAAAVQRIRRHLFEVRGLPRSRATVRGYWKHGRAAGGDDS